MNGFFMFVLYLLIGSGLIFFRIFCKEDICGEEVSFCGGEGKKHFRGCREEGARETQGS